MAFKLDISKAYDKVNWDLLFKVLLKLGFNQKMVSMIRECVTTVQFSVLINGTPRGCFKAEKGIRQGDPLSPYLFIMIAEVLSRNVTHLVSNGRLQGFKVASTLPPSNIQQFMDDTFLFGKSSVMEAKGWKILLANYAKALEQCINYEKSNLFFFNTPNELQLRILSILRCKMATLPGTYLGLPLIVKEVTPTF
ncbi:uncharacterized mitochondrial protein AtMg01250-like [Cryptomeria japonica]|uniref:uncharacterized mitochondrial protein AtMg01250-like n=1 Tax=Cryptomeria japonica TaxID=3369 RepID=UPI0027DA0C89|nr:uncharacterized mitochondrial protein AtMg01250-like [Cryptomeria japonica]